MIPHDRWRAEQAEKDRRWRAEDRKLIELRHRKALVTHAWIFVVAALVGGIIGSVAAAIAIAASRGA